MATVIKQTQARIHTSFHDITENDQSFHNYSETP